MATSRFLNKKATIARPASKNAYEVNKAYWYEIRSLPPIATIDKSWPGKYRSIFVTKADNKPSIIKFQITPIDMAEIGDLNSNPKIMPNIP